ncbi:hypothetical protein KY289_035745 [Solanum tuberosum]|nr:hypothetical protein KY289_035745 [Solanum tuberosum]
MGTMMSVIWWSNNSNLNVADSTCVGDVRNELTGDANCVSKSGNAQFQSIGDGQRDQLAKVAAKLGESVGEEHTSLTDASVINQALVAAPFVKNSGQQPTSVRIGSPIRNTTQQIVGSQATNSSARAIVPEEVPCLNTFDALLDNIVLNASIQEIPSLSLELLDEQHGYSRQQLMSTRNDQNVEKDIVDEEEKRVSSPPKNNKLSPAAPILVPRSAKSVMPGKGFAIN